jgi:hypothetical protein
MGGGFFLLSALWRGAVVVISIWNSPLRKTQLENIDHQSFLWFFIFLFCYNHLLCRLQLLIFRKIIANLDTSICCESNTLSIDGLFSVCALAVILPFFQFIHFTTGIFVCPLHSKWTHNMEVISVHLSVSMFHLQSYLTDSAYVWV